MAFGISESDRGDRKKTLKEGKPREGRKINGMWYPRKPGKICLSRQREWPTIKCC